MRFSTDTERWKVLSDLEQDRVAVPVEAVILVLDGVDASFLGQCLRSCVQDLVLICSSMF